MNTPDDLARWGAKRPERTRRVELQFGHRDQHGEAYRTSRDESNHDTMILPVHDVLRARLAGGAHDQFGLAPADVPPIVIDYPPNRALGDLGAAGGLRAGAPPAQGAARHRAGAGRRARTGRGRVARRGRAERLPELLPRPRARSCARGSARRRRPRRPVRRTGKTIVEHTAINPNKAAHIGHLRNSALGDTLVRVLRFRGVPVEVQNYIDDTGVQVADVVVGFQRARGQAARRGPGASPRQPRFDYYCWDLYARVTEWYDERQGAARDPRRARCTTSSTAATTTAELGAFIAERIVRCHLKTMARLNIDYDLLTWEGDILRLKFWARAFEILKETGRGLPADRGQAGGLLGDEDRRGRRRRPEAESATEDGEAEEREKVIVRSNGTVTYVGKDIAYQFWKFGLLGHRLHYRPFATRTDGDDAVGDDQRHSRGGRRASVVRRARARTYNVIDVRQSYLQKLLKQALAAMGHAAAGRAARRTSRTRWWRSRTPTARELGYDAAGPEDAKKPFVEVSGRKGLGVKADDLIDRSIARRADGSGQAQRRSCRPTSVARIAEKIARRRGPLLHGEVLAHARSSRSTSTRR